MATWTPKTLGERLAEEQEFASARERRPPCPHCALPSLPGYRTCGASDCQESEYHANRQRNLERRRR